jgi:hypothetical protein
MRHAGTWIAGALLLGGGCDFEQPVSPGELGNGQFRYVCAGVTDPACGPDGGADRFPDVLAVGGRFGLAYEPDEGPTPRVEPVAPSVLGDVDGVLAFLRAGTSAVLAVRGDVVVDVVHLDAEAVDEVVVQLDVDGAWDRGGVVGSVELVEGESADLEAVLRDVLDRPLAGSVELHWASADPGVIEIASLQTERRIAIEAVAAGATEIVITSSAFASTTIPVVVTGSTERDSS